MQTLALDVDGVLLDPDRGGHGDWMQELERRFGLTRPQLRDAFFAPAWSDVATGRRAIEDALGESLRHLESPAGVDEVLACWFDADFVPFEATFSLARRASVAGVRVVLATNQEHRRAAYLEQRLSAAFPIAAVLYSADLGYEKHAPQFFELASERLGVAAGDRSGIVFVDDAEHNVEVARRAGWRAVHAPPGSDWICDVEALLGLDGDQADPPPAS